MAPRFYVDCDFQPDSTLVLPEKPAHHASRVLRMREGDSAVLFDGRGNEAQCILHFFSDRTEANILSVAPSHTESPLKTVLIQALVSQEKLAEDLTNQIFTIRTADIQAANFFANKSKKD